MSDNKKRWIKRIIIVVLASIISIWVTLYKYNTPMYDGTRVSVFHAISDGLFVAGFLNFGFGVLIWISTTGFFDIFGYSAKSILNFFLPRSWMERVGMTPKGDFYEYKVKKQEKRKDPLLPIETLFLGIGFILVSLVLTIWA